MDEEKREQRRLKDRARMKVLDKKIRKIYAETDKMENADLKQRAEYEKYSEERTEIINRRISEGADLY
ncbi:hypothetical protein SAMN05444483_10988 [Salegentibacter echinorum]|uniref:Uncharacterized protein n=1 Tax=Salegentibacter echinorum TaxID=1073325 RepID=A0A1M5J2E6_SALEC|nr:hypothetical protein [Salegentibacter echinorum]SHG34768.1 hypothetical protein SAMN05444483_10988 [Salegentibacter echinorum]